MLKYIKNSVKHFNTITAHKLLVMKYCFKIGLYKQGLLHDLSKYSFIEFMVGVKYYQGNKSPIDEEKRLKGYSLGWLHHKGKNKHHWEYWYDFTAEGYGPIEMPLKYIAEMVCDRIAASKIYMKEKYTDSCAYEYFINNLYYTKMHPKTISILKNLLSFIKDNGEEKGFMLIKEYLKNHL